MLGEATGLRKVYPTLFLVGGDRQEGRVDREEEGHRPNLCLGHGVEIGSVLCY